MAEKQATITRLQAEIDALEDRKARLGKRWAEVKKELKAQNE